MKAAYSIGTISRIYKQLLKFNSEQAVWLENGQKTWRDISLKRICGWQISKHTKNCSTFFIKELTQITPKLKPQLDITDTLIIMAKIKNSDIKCWQGYREMDHSYIAGGNMKCYSYLENNLAVY